MNPWKVVLAPTAAATVRALPPDVKRSVRAALDAIAKDPSMGKELLRELKGLRSYRVRRYRVVYALVPGKHLVQVVAVGHRVSIYEEIAAGRDG
ncbi:MAG TPA: type II toxin-antitoxin system RelE/ParE family toxin [Polyangiaceae bacterium]